MGSRCRLYEVILVSTLSLAMISSVSCRGYSDFAKKRDDPNHHVVRSFVKRITWTSDCTKVKIGIGNSIERKLVECTMVDGNRQVRNLRNGTVLQFSHRPNLDYLAEKGKRSVILDTRNRYAFWVDEGVLVGFSKMTSEDTDRFREYQKPGVFDDLWTFQDVPVQNVSGS